MREGQKGRGEQNRPYQLQQEQEESWTDSVKWRNEDPHLQQSQAQPDETDKGEEAEIQQDHPWYQPGKWRDELNYQLHQSQT